jgi:hypothetical protein
MISFGLMVWWRGKCTSCQSNPKNAETVMKRCKCDDELEFYWELHASRTRLNVVCAMFFRS